MSSPSQPSFRLFVNPFTLPFSFSRLTLHSMQPLIDEAHKRTLTITDICNTYTEKDQQQRFMQEWNSRMDDYRLQDKQSKFVYFGVLCSTLNRYFGLYKFLIVNMLFTTIFFVSSTAVPFLLSLLIAALQDNNLSACYYWIAAIAGCLLVNSFVFGFRVALVANYSMDIISACNAALFHKLLQLESPSLSALSRNLSNSYLISSLILFGPQMIISVAALLGFIIFLSMKFLVSVIPIIVALICLAYFQHYFVKRVLFFKRSYNNCVESRSGAIEEIINLIRVIKFNVYESVVFELFKKLRLKERSIASSILFRLQMNYSFLFNAVSFVSYFFFITYYYTTDTMTLSFVYFALPFINMLRAPIIMLQNQFNSILCGTVGLKELQQLLLEKEISSTQINNKTGTFSQYPAISIKNASFHWQSFALQHVNFACALDERAIGGQLICLVGRSATGKSSLLAAIRGAMPCSTPVASMSVTGAIMDLPQQPIIFNCSIRDNILLGTKLNEHLYNECIQLSGFEEEIRGFPEGDATIVHAKGKNLSGGQRSRLALARMLYRRHESNIFLFDDLFSALDMKVAQQIMKNAIMKTLVKENNIVIIAMNSHLNLAQYANRIVVLNSPQSPDHSSIEYEGTFESVCNLYEELLKMRMEEENTPKDEQITGVNNQSTKSNKEQKNAINHAPIKALAVASPISKPPANSRLLSRYFSYISTHRNIYIGFGLIVFFVLLTLAQQVARVFADFVLTLWANNSIDLSTDYIVIIYSMLTLAIALLIIFRGLLINMCTSICSDALFVSLLSSLLNSPFSVLYRPGRQAAIQDTMTNQFNNAENELIAHFSSLTINVCSIICTLGLMIYATSYSIIVIGAFIVLMFILIRADSKPSVNVKQIVSKSRAPLVGILNEAIYGIEVIRSFRVEQFFVQQFFTALDRDLQAGLVDKLLEVWLKIRVDFLMITLFTVFSILVVIVRDRVDINVASLAIFSLFQVYAGTVFAIIIGKEYKTALSAASRVFELIDVPSESDEDAATQELKRLHVPMVRSISCKQSKVVYDEVSMAYAEDGPLVLNKLSFTINRGEALGICGRTGSGKSSCIAALCKINPILRGSISINDEDISKIPLSLLRAQMTVISQEAEIFYGRSIRFNIDPLDLLNDQEINGIIKQLHLTALIDKLANGFNETIQSHSLSSGQKQLICFARAIGRKSPLLVLDEATALVDNENDEILSHLIHSCQATKIIIAHRLNTIMECTNIIVLSSGCLVESGAPSDLLRDPTSQLANYVNVAGKQYLKSMTELADLSQRSRSIADRLNNRYEGRRSTFIPASNKKHESILTIEMDESASLDDSDEDDEAQKV